MLSHQQGLTNYKHIPPKIINYEATGLRSHISETLTMFMMLPSCEKEIFFLDFSKDAKL